MDQLPNHHPRFDEDEPEDDEPAENDDIMNFVHLYAEHARQLAGDGTLLEELREERIALRLREIEDYSEEKEQEIRDEVNALEIHDFTQEEIQYANEELADDMSNQMFDIMEFVNESEEEKAHDDEVKEGWEMIQEIREEYRQRFPPALREAFDRAYPRVIELFEVVDDKIAELEPQ